MKQFIIICIALFAVSFSMTSCGAKSDAAKTNMETVDKTSKEYTSKYICPMHCAGSGSDEMGKCPVCGMDYELNEDFVELETEMSGSELENESEATEEGHEGHDHEGHDHDNHEGHNH